VADRTAFIQEHLRVWLVFRPGLPGQKIITTSELTATHAYAAITGGSDVGLVAVQLDEPIPDAVVDAVSIIAESLDEDEDIALEYEETA